MRFRQLLIVLISLLFLTGCEPKEMRTYKIELTTGEVYHVKASGYYWYKSSNRVEFHGDRGMFFNVKYVIEESTY